MFFHHNQHHQHHQHHQHYHHPRTFFLLISFSIVLTTHCLNTLMTSDLPALIKSTYLQFDTSTLSITMDNHFKLTLSSFDSLIQQSSTQTHNKTITLYPITLTQTYQFTNPNLQHTSSQTITYLINLIANKQPIIDEALPITCKTESANMILTRNLKTINSISGTIDQNGIYHPHSYLHLPFRSLFYVLNRVALQLSAYYYNQSNLQFLANYKLGNTFIDKSHKFDHQTKQHPQSQIIISTDSKQHYLYMFTSIGLWSISTKTILTNVVYLDGGINGFDPKQWNGVDKVLHGRGGIMIILKINIGVFIVPEMTESEHKDRLGSSLGLGLNDYLGNQQPSPFRPAYTTITAYNEISLLPADIQLSDDYLYILDFSTGIYVFQLSGTLFKPLCMLSFQSYSSTPHFKVYQNTLLLLSTDIEGTKITQLHHNHHTNSFQLVRFYKQDCHVSMLEVFEVLTHVITKDRRRRQSQFAYHNLMFIINHMEEIIVYPFAIDPRLVNKAFNGVKLPYNKIEQIYHIRDDHYLIVTIDSLEYVVLTINPATLICTTIQPKNGQLSVGQYLLQISSNASDCTQLQHDVTKSNHNINPFNHYCELTTTYVLSISDPEQSQRNKMFMYGVVMATICMFVIGVYCLIVWRQNKMIILRRLREEINRFRSRHKKMQPFAQILQNKQIQIEVPDVAQSNEIV